MFQPGSSTHPWVTRELAVIETTGNSERGASMILVGHGPRSFGLVKLDRKQSPILVYMGIVSCGRRSLRSGCLFQLTRTLLGLVHGRHTWRDHFMISRSTVAVSRVLSYQNPADMPWGSVSSCTYQSSPRMSSCEHSGKTRSLQILQQVRMVNVLEHCAIYWPLNLLTVFMASSSHLWKELLASSVTMCQRCT